MTDAIRQIGVSEVTYYRCQEFGGLRIEQVKRMKEIELAGYRYVTQREALVQWARWALTASRPAGVRT